MSLQEPQKCPVRQLLQQINIMSKEQQARYKIREFEWFEMQTRVRQMVTELISPFQKRLMQNSNSINNLKAMTSEQATKLEQLKQLVTCDPNGGEIDAFKQIDEKFEKHALMVHEMKNMLVEQGRMYDQRFLLQEQRLKENSEILINNMQIKERVNEELREQNNNIEEFRNQLQALIVSVNSEVIKNLKEQQEMFKKANEADQELENRIVTLQQCEKKTGKTFEQFAAKNAQINAKQIHLQEQIQKIEDSITAVTSNLSYTKKMSHYLHELQQKIRVMQFNLQTLSPLITQAQIGDTLYNIVPPKLRRRLLVFENAKYWKLNNEVLTKNYREVADKFDGLDLLEMVQKRSAKELIELKRKKLLSMGLNLDTMSYELREKYYRDVSVLDDQDEEENQIRNRKPTVDESQINTLIKYQLQDIEKKMLKKIQQELAYQKKYIFEAQQQLHRMVNDCTTEIDKFKESINHFQTDQLLQNKYLKQSIDKVAVRVDNNSLEFKKINENLFSFIQFCSLVNHLQIQDELDKQSISLIGVKETFNEDNGSGVNRPAASTVSRKIVDFNSKCFSCCGYPASTIAAFKMACLTYNPSEITIQSKEYKREEILEISTKILQYIKNRLGDNLIAAPQNADDPQPHVRSETLGPEYVSQKDLLDQRSSQKVQFTEVQKDLKASRRNRRRMTTTVSSGLGINRASSKSTSHRKDSLPSNISYIFNQNKRKNLAFLS